MNDLTEDFCPKFTESSKSCLIEFEATLFNPHKIISDIIYIYMYICAGCHHNWIK